MKDKMLEIGDELFYYVGYSSKGMVSAGKVDRVTKTLACIGNLKLRRKLSMDYTNEPGVCGYSYRTYRLVTDEVRKEIKRQDERRALMKPIISMIDGGRQSVNRLTNNQLERINAILAESRESSESPELIPPSV